MPGRKAGCSGGCRCPCSRFPALQCAGEGVSCSCWRPASHFLIIHILKWKSRWISRFLDTNQTRMRLADRAALVLQGSAGLTCARSGGPWISGARLSAPRASRPPCSATSAHWPSRDLLHFSHLYFSPSDFLTLPGYVDPLLLRIPLARLIPVQLKSHVLQDPCGSLQAALNRCSCNFSFWHG